MGLVPSLADRAGPFPFQSQFEFVCEAVVQVHREGTVRPLTELSTRD